MIKDYVVALTNLCSLVHKNKNLTIYERFFFGSLSNGVGREFTNKLK